MDRATLPCGVQPLSSITKIQNTRAWRLKTYSVPSFRVLPSSGKCRAESGGTRSERDRGAASIKWGKLRKPGKNRKSGFFFAGITPIFGYELGLWCRKSPGKMARGSVVSGDGSTRCFGIKRPMKSISALANRETRIILTQDVLHQSFD